MTEHHNDIESASAPDGGSGGFVALAVLAAALGAGAAVLLAPDEGSKTRRRVGRGLRSLRGDAAERVRQLQREVRRRNTKSRREKRIVAVAGLLVGAGIAALLTSRGGEVRTRLGGTLSRIKVGAIDRIERLRPRPDDAGSTTADEREVRSVQELGRDPNTVF